MAVLLASSSGAGCYRYAPMEEGAGLLQRGDEMQVSLNRPIPVDLGEITVDDAVLVRGEFIEQQEDGTLLLTTASARSASGVDRPGDGQTTSVPADAIAAVDKRVLNGVATALVAVPIVGGAVAISAVALSGTEGDEGGNSGGKPPID
jgi:hypothetical protein